MRRTCAKKTLCLRARETDRSRSSGISACLRLIRFCCALLCNIGAIGCIRTWGNELAGGGSFLPADCRAPHACQEKWPSNLGTDLPTRISRLFATNEAFAAIRIDGTALALAGRFGTAIFACSHPFSFSCECCGYTFCERNHAQCMRCRIWNRYVLRRYRYVRN